VYRIHDIIMAKTGPLSSKTKGKAKRLIAKRNRHKRLSAAIDEAISSSTVRKLARRAGIKMLASDSYAKTRKMIIATLSKVANDAICIAKYCKSKTIMPNHTLAATRRNGLAVYG
jgi:histone H3/H4